MGISKSSMPGQGSTSPRPHAETLYEQHQRRAEEEARARAERKVNERTAKEEEKRKQKEEKLAAKVSLPLFPVYDELISHRSVNARRDLSRLVSPSITIRKSRRFCKRLLRLRKPRLILLTPSRYVPILPINGTTVVTSLQSELTGNKNRLRPTHTFKSV